MLKSGHSSHKSRRYCVKNCGQEEEKYWSMHTNPMHTKLFSARFEDKVFANFFLELFAGKIACMREMNSASRCSWKWFIEKPFTKSCYRIKKSSKKYKRAARQNRDQRLQICNFTLTTLSLCKISQKIPRNFLADTLEKVAQFLKVLVMIEMVEV